MQLDIEHLRSKLRDVPQTTSFSRSVELLEDAFEGGSNSSWEIFRYGGDADFFGEKTLQALLGPGFRDHMPWREDWNTGEVLSERHRNMRMRLQRYVVVGYRTDSTGLHAASVLFHSGRVSYYDGTHGPPSNEVGALELVRARFGLLNRRQAHLLANHLNRFRRNRHHGEALTWLVRLGPLADTSARTWLDAVAGENRYLQHTIGELPSWGFGVNTDRGLKLYALESKAAAHPDQVFGYGRARCLLPPRFFICAGHGPGEADIPAGVQWNAVRAAGCEHAVRLAEAAGLRVNWFDFSDIRPEEMWGRDEGAPPNDGPGYTSEPADVYATSFSRQEALQVMRALRKSGYRGIRAFVEGADGSYVRRESGNPYFWRHEVRVERELTVDDEAAFGVRLYAYYTDFESHRPLPFTPLQSQSTEG